MSGFDQTKTTTILMSEYRTNEKEFNTEFCIKTMSDIIKMYPLGEIVQSIVMLGFVGATIGVPLYLLYDSRNGHEPRESHITRPILSRRRQQTLLYDSLQLRGDLTIKGSGKEISLLSINKRLEELEKKYKLLE